MPITAEVTTAVRAIVQRSRTATTIAAISAAGHTLIQVATVSSTAASRGMVPSTSIPTIAIGTMTASMRPSATGPSSSRNASHHHPTRATRGSRPNAVITANAAASTIITKRQPGRHVEVGPEQVGDDHRHQRDDRIHPGGVDARPDAGLEAVLHPEQVDEGDVAERVARRVQRRAC